MNREPIESVKPVNAQELLRSQPVGPERAHRRGQGRQKSVEFDVLLADMARKVENLKGKASHGKTAAPLSTDGAENISIRREIHRPKDLQAALREADGNFRSCMQLKEKLAEAYKATMDGVNGGK